MWALKNKFKLSKKLDQKIALAKRLIEYHSAELTYEDVMYYTNFIEMFR